MIASIKSIFVKKSDNANGFCITKKRKNIGNQFYKTISEAIEATKGEEYFIYEKKEEKVLYKGKWKNYACVEKVKKIEM